MRAGKHESGERYMDIDCMSSEKTRVGEIVTDTAARIVKAPTAADRIISISRAAARDTRLSYRAIGVLTVVLEELTRPECYGESSPSTSAKAISARRSHEGRDAILKTLSQLESAGYLVRSRVQDARGHWSTEWRISDETWTPDVSTSRTWNGIPPGRTESGFLDFGETKLSTENERCTGHTEDGFSGPGNGGSVDNYVYAGHTESGFSGVIYSDADTEPRDLDLDRDLEIDLQEEFPPPPISSHGTLTPQSADGQENIGGGNKNQQDQQPQRLRELAAALDEALPIDLRSALRTPAGAPFSAPAAKTAREEIKRLDALGYTPRDLARAAASRSWTGAGIGVLVAWLRGLDASMLRSVKRRDERPMRSTLVCPEHGTPCVPECEPCMVEAARSRARHIRNERDVAARVCGQQGHDGGMGCAQCAASVSPAAAVKAAIRRTRDIRPRGGLVNPID